MTLLFMGENKRSFMRQQEDHEYETDYDIKYDLDYTIIKADGLELSLREIRAGWTITKKDGKWVKVLQS
jgi:hypothetical protein